MVQEHHIYLLKIQIELVLIDLQKILVFELNYFLNQYLNQNYNLTYGLTNLNLDLNQNLPRQEISSWKDQLEKALNIAPPHISIYDLSIEKGTVFEWRQTIGATNPDEAGEGTIRKLYASSLGEYAVHGSDSDENAKKEIAFFFNESELT